VAIAPGQLVGNYQVLSRLGVGGMGTVYLAEHPIIGKKVALKVIHRELAGNREVIGRFYPGGARGQPDRQRAHRRDP
jgi:serine/threonine protein kinase